MNDRAPVDPQGFMAGRHPRVFIGADEIGALRERVAVAGSVPAVATAALVARCEAYLDPTHALWLDPAWTREEFLVAHPYGAANHAGGAVHDLSFAWLATDDDRYLQRLRDLLRVLCVLPTERAWRNGPHGARYQTVDLITRISLNGDLSMAYDIVAEAIPAAERDALATMLYEHVVLPYRRDFVRDPRRYSGMIGVNPPWHELNVYAWALAAIYEPTRDAGALEELAQLVRHALHRGVDQMGVIGEGSNYGQHDAFRWLSIAVILRRAGIADLWQEEPQLTRMLDVWGHLIMPAQGCIVNPGDTPSTYGGTPVYALLMSARHAPDVATRARHNGLHCMYFDSTDRLRDPAAKVSPGLLMIWEHGDTPAPTQAESGMPLDLVPGQYGVGIFRASWDDDAMVASLLAAQRTTGSIIHQQFDAGHMSLYALGECFSVDAGYGDNAGDCHSIMLPATLAEGRDVWIGGRVSGQATSADAAWMQVDIGAQWGCCWYHRDLLMLRDPDLPQYTILLDDANEKNDWSTYHWRLNSHADNTIDLQPAATPFAVSADPLAPHATDSVDRATIRGRRHRLEIAFAPPGPTEYPRAHELALSVSEHSSRSFDYVRPGLVLGQGPRPQLIATLDGYNGRLLTALIPRRDTAPPVVIRRLAAPVQQGLVLDFGDHVDTILCNPLDRRLAAFGIAGEARVAVIRRDRSGRLIAWLAVDAYALSVDGAACLPRQGVAIPLASGRSRDM